MRSPNNQSTPIRAVAGATVALVAGPTFFSLIYVAGSALAGKVTALSFAVFFTLGAGLLAVGPAMMGFLFIWWAMHQLGRRGFIELTRTAVVAGIAWFLVWSPQDNMAAALPFLPLVCASTGCAAAVAWLVAYRRRITVEAS